MAPIPSIASLKAPILNTGAIKVMRLPTMTRVESAIPRATHTYGDRRKGRDGYDLIEWLAKQEWCNGRVGMAGNSALAMAQWRIAAEQPPHLTCIAPWEGTAEIYREFINMGGFTECGFNPFLVEPVVGNGLIEDYYQMAKDYPLMNAYWADKVPDFKKIKFPLTSRWDGIIFTIAAPPTASGRLAQHRSGCVRTGTSSGRISIAAKVSTT